MNTKNRPWKWILIVALTALAILAIYPPSEKLKPGIDLAGGTSLIYELDMTGLSSDERSGLAERVMNILKTRVDPNGQFNLVWRPIGNNRLEIQMPRPPQGARDRRKAYDAARDQVRALNVARAQLSQALKQSGAEREKALAALVHGVTGRAALLENVAQAWDAYTAVRGKGDVAAEVEAQSAYENALDDAMQSSLTMGRLTDVLGLRASERVTEIQRLKDEYPSYVSAIDATVAAYDRWVKKRGSLEDPSDLKRLLRGAGVLEFRILAERDLSNPTMLKSEDPALREPIGKYVDQLRKRGPRPKADDQYEWFGVDNFVKFLQSKSMKEAKAKQETGSVVVEKYAGKYYVLAHVDDGKERFGLTRNSPKWSLKRAFPTRDYNTGRPCIDFTLDAHGGRQFANVTQENLHRELAIFLDGIGISHATIQSQISQRGQITGNFTNDRVSEIVKRLEAGSLPARLNPTPLMEKNTGPSLGKRNRTLGLRAALYGFVSVAVFMLVYYWLLGVLADIALILNLLFVLAVMASLEATFTLPGIAGLILTVGMAVDANVLIYERIREELNRGVALKKAVKLGYEKAFSTIVDANLTTLITCVILGYVGSEEVKGFAMTLGFGVVTSMFTALFVTRLILNALINKGLVKSLPMMHIIGQPKINWIGLRKVFWPISMCMVLGGLGAFVFVSVTDKEALYDIEFLGGTSIQVELKDGVDMDATQVRNVITGHGKVQHSAVDWLKNAAQAMRSATVTASSLSGEFDVKTPNLDPIDVNVILRTVFEKSLTPDGFSASGDSAHFVTKDQVVPDPTKDNPKQTKDVPVDLDMFKAAMAAAADYTEKAAGRLAGARVQSVSDVGAQKPEKAFEVVTVESNKELVRDAILGVLGDKLKVERRIEFTLVTDPQRAPSGMYPILEEQDYLGSVIGDDSPMEIWKYKGGVALVFDHLNPVQTIAALKKRFQEMRLQPQFEKYEARVYDIFGLTEAGKVGEEPTYSKIAIVVGDESLMYSDDPAKWEERLAKPELKQAEEALSSEKALRKVVQFAPQVASQTQQQALIAMVLALGAIVAYIWLRFGTMQYGLAAIVALVHDVSVVLGVICIGDYLGFADMRVDLAMIAAILTIIGYSLNDTIVVFDRIRENRGKLSKLSTEMINSSINMTLSRTLLTSVTTFLAVACLYWMGGPGVEGFSFALLGGVVVGTYSSIGIAAPLLRSRRLLHTVVYLMIAVLVIGLVAVSFENRTMVIVISALVAVILAVMLNIERRLDDSSAVPA